MLYPDYLNDTVLLKLLITVFCEFVYADSCLSSLSIESIWKIQKASVSYYRSLKSLFIPKCSWCLKLWFCLLRFWRVHPAYWIFCLKAQQWSQDKKRVDPPKHELPWMKLNCDKLQSWLLKEILEQISRLPAIISEKSWKTNEVLEDLWRANSPCYPKGEEEDLGIYNSFS